jgi:hypothetical protein
MSGFPVAVRVIGKQISRSIATGLSFGWSRMEAAGEDFVQLNRHPGQSQPHQAGILEPALLDSTEIPALARSRFAADPVADFDRSAFVKLPLQDQLSRSATSLAMEFEPATTDRSVGQQDRCASGGRAVMQNTTSRHQRAGQLG